MDVSPRNPLFRLGGRQQLVCSFHDCPTMPSVSWSLLGDRPLTAIVSTNRNNSVVTFDPVQMEHEGWLLCKVGCGDESKQVKTSVQVYCESRVGPRRSVLSHRELTVLCLFQPSHQPLSSQDRTA